MRVSVPRETAAYERRVALVPETVPRLTAAGLDVVVESGAGQFAYAFDTAYRAAGAIVLAGDPLSNAAAVLSVAPLTPAQAEQVPSGAVTISFLQPAAERDLIAVFTERKISAFSLDRLPRITRAQPMDALSSQALVAGYRAVLVAAERLPRFFPLFMTAAGTVPPARVLVLGAGVAGLQAIATARRLGAVVEAYDVRAAAAEEVRSLGATFIDLGLETQEGGGGYAREQSADFLARQHELIGAHVADADIVITTAAIPGRPAPRLVTTDMVERMRAGSVVVDVAAESGGNCELSQPGEQVRYGDVIVWGARNIWSDLPDHASRLYSSNVAALLLLMTRSEGVIAPDLSDEVLAGCCVTYEGEVRA